MTNDKIFNDIGQIIKNELGVCWNSPDIYSAVDKIMKKYHIVPKPERKYSQAEIDSWNGMGK